ncbi:hypothetical protein FACS189475_06410 [Betaproteobacteria bacterium]|nr:hypothetical protein FACS189475_06410 [Betaproteobacteria bacterium]
MKRTVLFETLVLWGIGVVSVIEALRLILVRNPNVLYDKLGPGYFVLLIGVALIITGTYYFFVNYKKESDVKEMITADKEATLQVVSTIAASAGYIFLIGIIGYVLASFIFFMIQLWIFGIRHWKVDIGLAVLLTLVYYFLFVEFCSMVFPRGYLIPLFD